jgi:hypothetical protein
VDLLYGIPAIVALVGAAAIAIVAALSAQALVHRRFRSSDFVGHNEVGGIIIVVSGSLYAVVLGFLTVVAWEHFQDAREIVVVESNADIDIWHSTVGLPLKVRQRVRSDMIRYADVMVAREWALMKHGKFDPDAAIIGMDAMTTTGAMVPANQGEANAQIITMQLLNVMHDARQRRIAMGHSGLSWFEWLILLSGAVCIVCFCWLFGVTNRRAHMLMTSTVVVIIVSTLVMLFELQYPFRSAISIEPDAWSGAITHLHQMQSGEMSGMGM